MPDHDEAYWRNVEHAITLWRELGRQMHAHLQHCSDTWTPDDPILKRLEELMPELAHD